MLAYDGNTSLKQSSDASVRQNQLAIQSALTPNSSQEPCSSPQEPFTFQDGHLALP